MDKQELVRFLEDIAVLLELQDENVFKIRAYQTAAHAIALYDGDLDGLRQPGVVDGMKGIGKTIGQHVREYLADGSIPYRDELRAAIPQVLFELLEIPGLGAKKARQLVQGLQLSSVGELEYACRENRLVALPGFGSKTQEKILRGIELRKRFKGRFRLGDALPAAQQLCRYLQGQTGIDRVELAGSIRRQMETVKDIDLVVAAASAQPVRQALEAYGALAEWTAQGETKLSFVLESGLPVDVRVVQSGEFVYAWHHLTGSKEHHILLRGLAKDRGLRLNEYGNGLDVGGTVLAGEAELYGLLGLDYIPPELREGKDEVDLASIHQLPQLINAADLRGAFHVHSLYSDGSAGLQALGQAATQRGWQYLGISDHSQTAAYAGGMKLANVVAQREEIAVWNATQPGVRLLAGVESDILPDGSLDYPDEVLRQFDFVIASVHSSFQLSEAEMTRRLLRALENPYVTMLGHLTGRLLLAREGYALDVAAILRAAGATGTMVEINANPYRLDLDWRWCRYAKEHGVLFSVNPDAHGVEELRYVDFGIAVARKGGLTAADVINTRDMEQLLPLLRRKRSG